MTVIKSKKMCVPYSCRYSPMGATSGYQHDRIMRCALNSARSTNLEFRNLIQVAIQVLRIPELSGPRYIAQDHSAN